ncbi:MAG: M15 family metallopeptidase [Rikenellaceae bacterium]
MKFNSPSIDKQIAKDDYVVRSSPHSKERVNLHSYDLKNHVTIKKLIPLLTLIFISTSSLMGQIVDSNISLSEAIEGTTAPDSIIKELVIVDVEYFSTDSLLHRGQIVVTRKIEQEVRAIFEYIKEIKYPVESVIPIKFDLPNGNTSMAGLNNTYSFHYRTKAGGSGNLSQHSLGLAIDFNPFDNPYISKNGKVIPSGGTYDPSKREALTKECDLVKKFISLGWTWGGNWKGTKDYMHFERWF